MKETKLFELARSYEDLRLKIKGLEAERKRLGDKIAKELQRRELKSIEGQGLTVTLVVNPRITYDLIGAREVLGRDVKKILKPVVDPDAVEVMIEKGELTKEQVKKFVTVKESTYPRISPSERSA